MSCFAQIATNEKRTGIHGEINRCLERLGETKNHYAISDCNFGSRAWQPDVIQKAEDTTHGGGEADGAAFV